jgi:rhodanese-related sulfurtransferase
MLIDKGFVRVRPLLGGIDAWGDAGYGLDQHE